MIWLLMIMASFGFGYYVGKDTKTIFYINLVKQLEEDKEYWRKIANGKMTAETTPPPPPEITNADNGDY